MPKTPDSSSDGSVREVHATATATLAGSEASVMKVRTATPAGPPELSSAESESGFPGPVPPLARSSWCAPRVVLRAVGPGRPFGPKRHLALVNPLLVQGIVFLLKQ